MVHGALHPIVTVCIKTYLRMLYSMKTGLCNKYLLSEIAAFFVRVVSQNITQLSPNQPLLIPVFYTKTYFNTLPQELALKEDEYHVLLNHQNRDCNEACTLENYSTVFIRQIPTYKDGPLTERIKIFIMTET